MGGGRVLGLLRGLVGSVKSGGRRGGVSFWGVGMADGEEDGEEDGRLGRWAQGLRVLEMVE